MACESAWTIRTIPKSAPCRNRATTWAPATTMSRSSIKLIDDASSHHTAVLPPTCCLLRFRPTPRGTLGRSADPSAAPEQVQPLSECVAREWAASNDGAEAHKHPITKMRLPSSETPRWPLACAPILDPLPAFSRRRHLMTLSSPHPWPPDGAARRRVREHTHKIGRCHTDVKASIRRRARSKTILPPPPKSQTDFAAKTEAQRSERG